MKPSTRWGVALLLAAAGAAPLFAAEGEGGGSIFAGDVGNVVWTLLIFGLVVFVLGRYAWGPLLDALQRREAFIRDALDSAKKDREEAAARLAEYADKVGEARQEAERIVDKARRDAEAVARRVEQEARVEAERLVERARREITLAQESAIQELYAVSGRLATDIAGRILARELTAADHQRLIRESIAELGRLDEA